MVHCIIFVILLQILCWLTPNLQSTYSHLFILLCYNLHNGICDNAFISRNDLNVAVGNRGKCVALGLPNVYHPNTTDACRCTFGSVDITFANTSADSERFCLQLQSQSGYITLNYILHHVDFIQFSISDKNIIFESVYCSTNNTNSYCDNYIITFDAILRFVSLSSV